MTVSNATPAPVKLAEPEGVIFPIEDNTRLSMTAPTEGLKDWDGVTYDVWVYLYQYAGEVGSGALNAYNLAGAYRSIDHLHQSHILRLPVGVPYQTYLRDEVNPCFGQSPWAREAWFVDGFRRIVELLPKASAKFPGMVSYFQNPEKRARNIRTPIKPGKFLKKFFGDVLGEEEIQELALAWVNYFAPRPLTITQDADEIEAVYRSNYNGSCMHFGNGGFAGDEHPARAYAGPDLGVAYIGTQDNCAGRCLVWPAKKIYFAKWYGDGARLEAALELAGWRSANSSEFDGARIQRIKWRSAFVVPYVDVACYADDMGDYLVLGSGNIGLRNTNGVSDDVCMCEDCDRHVDPDDTYHTHDGRTICSDCRGDDYFFCDVNDELYPDDQQAPTPGRYTVSLAAVRNSSDWFYCEYSEQWYKHEHYDQVELTDGDWCEQSYADQHGFYCEKAERYCLDMDSQVEFEIGWGNVSRDSFDSAAEMDAWLIENGHKNAPEDETADLLEAA